MSPIGKKARRIQTVAGSGESGTGTPCVCATKGDQGDKRLCFDFTSGRFEERAGGFDGDGSLRVVS